jgi:hypothetical protein
LLVISSVPLATGAAATAPGADCWAAGSTRVSLSDSLRFM